MKSIVAVLVESPLYFTMPLLERYGLVRRLQCREKGSDFSAMAIKLQAFLKVKISNR